METIGERIRHIRGGRSRSDFAARLGVHKNTIANYERNDRVPDATVIEHLVADGFDANWIVSGEGSMHREADGCSVDSSSTGPGETQTGQSPRDAVATVDAAALADVLKALRDHQKSRGIRWQPEDEAHIAAEIYAYVIEQEQPTAEDRARAIRLVTSVIEGMHGREDATRGAD